ncbi:MAG: hypothetical protein KAR05_07085 [Candidatus Omnitrophica bacterium]|nr:hypothetical protein [Candidatus Omnitrophota bacterium]
MLRMDIKMEETSRYNQLQMKHSQEWEDICISCGGCCGVFDGDPCEDLIMIETGKYYCRTYQDRFGMHKTLSGKSFRCVPVRNVLDKSWPGDMHCSYKRKI